MTTINPGTLTPSVAKPTVGQSVTFALAGASAASTKDVTFPIAETLASADGSATLDVTGSLVASMPVTQGVVIKSLKVGAAVAVISADGKSATVTVPSS